MGARACRMVAPDGGTGGRVGAGAWGGEAVTVCDRSRMAALMGSRVPCSPGQVGRVVTIDWMVPNWVVMVSS